MGNPKTKVLKEKVAALPIYPVVHVEDLGREFNKTATAYRILGKQVKIETSVGRSIYNIVSDNFTNPIPVFKITTTNKLTNEKNTINVICGDNAFTEEVSEVIKIVKLDGDAGVIDNLPIFTVCNLALNYFKLNKNGSFNANFHLVFPITEKMSILPNISKLKYEINNSIYEVEYYAQGLKRTEKIKKVKFDIPEKNIVLNVQGSMSLLAYSYLKDDHGSFYLNPVINNRGLVDTIDKSEIYSSNNLLSKQLVNNFPDEGVIFDLSSREMSISFLYGMDVRFSKTRTIPFGSWNIFEELLKLVNIITPSKRYSISTIRKMYSDNDIVSKEDKLYIDDKRFANKDEFKMSELYQIAFSSLEDKLYAAMINEYSNLASIMPNFNPKMVVLSGGGIYDNHGSQSPYISVIKRFISEKIDSSVKHTENKEYNYIFPHGLYSSTNYIFTAKENPYGVMGHAIGTILKTFLSDIVK